MIQEKEYYIDKKDSKKFSLKKQNKTENTNNGTGLTSLIFDSFVLKEKYLAQEKEKKS